MVNMVKKFIWMKKLEQEKYFMRQTKLAVYERILQKCQNRRQIFAYYASLMKNNHIVHLTFYISFKHSLLSITKTIF